MSERTLLLGPPGCGKTHTLIELVRSRLDAGVHPGRIGYVSFTRKAVEEARTRAGSAFGLTAADLPWFKTLHSLSYAALGLTTSQIMSREDWSAVSARMGVEIFDEADEDGPPLAQFSVGARRYLSIFNRARMRCIPLEREFSEAQDYTLKWDMQAMLRKNLTEYLRDTGKYTFVTMLEAAVTAELPVLDLLIVDEAQDLVPLQWAIVERLAARAREVWIAGDDDQAIHRWAGVDTSMFLRSAPSSRVLSQSYRLPRSVYRVSQHMIRSVSGRAEKPFRPADRAGLVGYCFDLRHVDMNSGSWTVMARTRYLASTLADAIRADGHYLTLFGKASIDEDAVQSVLLWEQLQKGPLSVPQVRRLYKGLPRQGPYKALKRAADKLLDMLPPDAMVGFDELARDFGLVAPIATPPEEVAGLPQLDRVYLRALRRRGERVDQPPRIKVTTMHAMKGGEDDNVLLYLGTSRRCAQSRFPDDEVRAFYVGATRARERLFLVASSHRYRFNF